MNPDLKFETKEELVNGEKILHYFINKKEVDKKTFDTLKPDYDNSIINKTINKNVKPLPYSSKPKEFPKLDIDDIDKMDDENYPDDTEEECVCPICQSRLDILDLINIVGSQNLSLDYLEESLNDILNELYEIAYNDGQINAFGNIANISVDIAEHIMNGDINGEDGEIEDN